MPLGRLRSIRNKLLVLVLAANLCTLLIAGGALLYNDLREYERDLRTELTTQANILGMANIAALEFQDAKVAGQNLALLKAKPTITAAALYTASGQLFARYQQDGVQGAFPMLPGADGASVDGSDLILFQRINTEHRILGTIFLRAPIDIGRRLEHDGIILLLVMMGSLVMGVALSSSLQASVARPILAIAELARAVRSKRDFSLRATRTTHDEIGELVDAFNDMLAEVGKRAALIEDARLALEREGDERRAAEREVLKLNAELESRVIERTRQLTEANRDLESFCYSVSHDLRTPLRAICGFAEVLERKHGEGLNDDAKRLIGIVVSEADRMGLLIDDLLTFARLGRQAMHWTLIDTASLVRSSFEQLPQPRTAVTVELRLGTLPDCHGDLALLRQVWVNLLSNAVKFTARSARPHVEVGAISDADRHTYYVRDNGVGFDQAQAGKLFGVFQRLHGDDEFAGNGVGLALVQRIVARHGGAVWAEGRVGEGATFYFTVPRRPEASTPA